jgi:hypothetical protein
MATRCRSATASLVCWLCYWERRIEFFRATSSSTCLDCTATTSTIERSTLKSCGCGASLRPILQNRDMSVPSAEWVMSLACGLRQSIDGRHQPRFFRVLDSQGCPPPFTHALFPESHRCDRIHRSGNRRVIRWTESAETRAEAFAIRCRDKQVVSFQSRLPLVFRQRFDPTVD